MKYKLAIFDLDGTLLDTLEDLAASLNFALSRGGYSQRTLEEVRSFVGNGVRRLVEQGLPKDVSPEITERSYTDFVCHYKVHSADHTQPYPGIPELLHSLRQQGMKIAVVTNKLHDPAQALCQRYFPGLIDLTVGQSPTLPKKPAPDSTLLILSQLGIANKDAVYIGDSDVDIFTAQNASLPCISVTWGFQSREKLLGAGAKTLADSVSDLLTLLQ